MSEYSQGLNLLQATDECKKRYVSCFEILQLLSANSGSVRVAGLPPKFVCLAMIPVVDVSNTDTSVRQLSRVSNRLNSRFDPIRTCSLAKKYRCISFQKTKTKMTTAMELERKSRISGSDLDRQMGRSIHLPGHHRPLYRICFLRQSIESQNQSMVIPLLRLRRWFRCPSLRSSAYWLLQQLENRE